MSNDLKAMIAASLEREEKERADKKAAKILQEKKRLQAEKNSKRLDKEQYLAHVDKLIAEMQGLPMMFDIMPQEIWCAAIHVTPEQAILNASYEKGEKWHVGEISKYGDWRNANDVRSLVRIVWFSSPAYMKESQMNLLNMANMVNCTVAPFDDKGKRFFDSYEELEQALKNTLKAIYYNANRMKRFAGV